MDSHWNDTDAATWAAAAERDLADRELALRVYTSRLIGQVPDLVLHGGGNTSVKVQRPDATGTLRSVIHVKGSGWDLGDIEAPGLPGMWLDPLLEARHQTQMSDDEMVVFLRQNMLDASGPNPSVEALLHAFLPAPVVDHTHSAAALAIANQPNAAEIARHIYGDTLCIVPYVMPGFKLSIAADRIFRDQGAGTTGMFLVNHGLFSFAEDAKTSYERILQFTSQCEDYLASKGTGIAAQEPGTKVADPEAHATVSALKQALGGYDLFAGGVHLDLRRSEAINRYLALPDLEAITARGTATPDHVIRIKPRPMIGAVQAGVKDWQSAVAEYVKAYQAYFQRHAPTAAEPKTMLDPLPRVALIRGLGLVGIGRSAKEASVAADLAEQTARIVPAAEAIGRFTPISEPDLFDMEYWTLEQAKLKKAA